MGTIKVGDTLPNFSFEDIDGKLHRLSEVVTDKTLITYVQPDCDACLVELERLKQAAKNQDDYDHVLLITSANPLHLQKLRTDYGLGCVILYDDERRFGSTLKIQSFPFNLVVNRSRVILAIHANTLFPDDYERFFEETRSIVGRDPCGPDMEGSLFRGWRTSRPRLDRGASCANRDVAHREVRHAQNKISHPLGGVQCSHPELVEG